MFSLGKSLKQGETERNEVGTMFNTMNLLSISALLSVFMVLAGSAKPQIRIMCVLMVVLPHSVLVLADAPYSGSGSAQACAFSHHILLLLLSRE